MESQCSSTPQFNTGVWGTLSISWSLLFPEPLGPLLDACSQPAGLRGTKASIGWVYDLHHPCYILLAKVSHMPQLTARETGKCSLHAQEALEINRIDKELQDFS